MAPGTSAGPGGGTSLTSPLRRGAPRDSGPARRAGKASALPESPAAPREEHRSPPPWQERQPGCPPEALPSTSQTAQGPPLEPERVWLSALATAAPEPGVRPQPVERLWPPLTINHAGAMAQCAQALAQPSSGGHGRRAPSLAHDSGTVFWPGSGHTVSPSAPSDPGTQEQGCSAGWEVSGFNPHTAP